MMAVHITRVERIEKTHETLRHDERAQREQAYPFVQHIIFLISEYEARCGYQAETLSGGCFT